MKALKIVGIALVVYVGLVVLFESLLGYFQPEPPGSITITTTDEDGNTHDRVLTELASDGKVYVAVNHWPRAWYRRVLENPNVQVARADGVKVDYVAVRVDGEEHDRVAEDNPLGIVIRFFMGFAPRYFVRLDPAAHLRHRRGRIGTPPRRFSMRSKRSRSAPRQRKSSNDSASGTSSTRIARRL